MLSSIFLYCGHTLFGGVRPRRRNFALLRIDVPVRIEPNHHSVTMVQILRNLHQPPVLAGTVICVVFVFINFHNHNMTAHVQEQVGPSPRASTFNLPVTYPGDIRKLSFYVRYLGDLLGLVVVDGGLIREQMDKAT